MAVCLGVTIAFSLTVIGVQELGKMGLMLSPAQAAWLPLVIFVPLAVWLSEALWK